MSDTKASDHRIWVPQCSSLREKYWGRPLARDLTGFPVR